MDDGLPSVGRFSPELLDLFIVMGTFGLIVLFAFFWALFIRKNKKRRIRRHRRHRPINPTLAELGGLPPVREEKKPDAPAPPP
jgi:hypothetical protein